jgi:hypothetical protein
MNVNHFWKSWGYLVIQAAIWMLHLLVSVLGDMIMYMIYIIVMGTQHLLQVISAPTGIFVGDLRLLRTAGSWTRNAMELGLFFAALVMALLTRFLSQGSVSYFISHRVGHRVLLTWNRSFHASRYEYRCQCLLIFEFKGSAVPSSSLFVGLVTAVRARPQKNTIYMGIPQICIAR